MEPGESSGTKRTHEVWARLVPADPRYSHIDIRMEEIEICSETDCSSSEKHNWCTIMKNTKEDFVTIKNTSTRGIVVDGELVDREEAVEIKSGSKIVAGPDVEGLLHFTFEVLENTDDPKFLTVSFDVDHSKCSICLNIWHDVVTAAPCLHNFCNGCFSEWLRRCQKNHQTVKCPQCRASVLYVGRNHFLHNIEESILEKNPTLMRSIEELVLLDKRANIQSNLILGTEKTSARKRPYLTFDGDGLDVQCPQCAADYGGYRCSQTTGHLLCHACGGMMPSRPDSSLPQICLGCDRAFCGAYWQAQGVNFGVINRMCTEETFKVISEQVVLQIPDCTHQNNRFEKYITESCIRQMGKTLQVVISEHISLFSNRQIDRTIFPLKNAELISPQTHLCTECYHKFVSYLLYWFRVTLPSSHLPPDASNRQNCWYGYACRTQLHNDAHARKRNHVCRPTRGNLNAPFPF